MRIAMVNERRRRICYSNMDITLRRSGLMNSDIVERDNATPPWCALLTWCVSTFVHRANHGGTISLSTVRS